MQREIPFDWAKKSTPETINATGPHMPTTKTNRWENNLKNMLYRWQHVYKQMQDNSTDEWHFETIRVPIWTSTAPN